MMAAIAGSEEWPKVGVLAPQSVDPDRSRVEEGRAGPVAQAKVKKQVKEL